MTVTFDNDYANISFWERYCDSKLARTIALCFPEYWKQQHQWYGKTYPNLQFTAEMANRKAYHWGKSHLADLDRLPWQDEESHPADAIDTSSSEKYASTILLFAIEYARNASPLRPDWPLSPNHTPLGDGTFFVRGVQLGEQQLIKSLLHPRSTLLTKYLRWGPQLLEYKQAATSHFCVAGVTRSGKTSLLLLLAQSVLPNDGRVIFFDAKSVLLSSLVRPEADPAKWFDILNPFDRRCVAWDIAADADTQHRANEVAALLFPQSPNDKSYFVNASRRLATAVIEILNQIKPKEWTFLDFLLSLRPAQIYKTFERHPVGRQLKETYLQKKSITTDNLISTLDSQLDPYMPIAAAWDKAEERLSLREWARNSQRSLLLGHSHSHPLAMGRINRVMVRLLSDALLDSQIEKPCRTFVFLDELESLGLIDTLPDLLNLGAEVGVTMALGFHDLDTLKAIYGQHTEGMLAMCSNMAFLRLNSRSTAHWAADLMGTQEVLFANRQETMRKGGNQEDVNNQVHITLAQQRMERHAVSTNHLTQLPLTSSAYGMNGYFVSHLHPAYRGHIPGNQLFPDDSAESEFSQGLEELYQKMTGKSLNEDETKALLWKRHSVACFEPRPPSDFEVPATAVPSYAKDEFFSHALSVDDAEMEQDDDELDDTNPRDKTPPDDEDEFEIPTIRLPPIKRVD